MTSKIYEATVASNIAFLKYWGKEDPESQWPANNSLSMTLKHAHTKTRARLMPKGSLQVTINGTRFTPRDKEAAKVYRHLEFLAKRCGTGAGLTINSHNSFPMAAGIASSASGFGALTVAALAAWTGVETLEQLFAEGFTRDELCHLARLGSGSACRSLYGGFVLWDKGTDPAQQTVKQLFPAEHWPLKNVIVKLSSQAKAVSSSDAHLAAWSSPLFGMRVAGSTERQRLLTDAIAARDITKLGPLLEAEALEMHSVMMTSSKPVCYLMQETVELISWLRNERAACGLKAYFTLDAGPNPHILCEAKELEKLRKLLHHKVSDDAIIIDEAGSGPELTALAVEDL